ncbi:hypothetical protein ACWDBD_44305 [Streptomyces sp. NPDC001118]
MPRWLQECAAGHAHHQPGPAGTGAFGGAQPGDRPGQPAEAPYDHAG